MMSKEKQIEDIRKVIGNCVDVVPGVCRSTPCSLCKAERLYNAGYRKQSEGEWVEKNVFFAIYKCSICGLYKDGHACLSKFCPNCGAKMKGV